MDPTKRCDECAHAILWKDSEERWFLKCPPSRIMQTRILDVMQYAQNCKQFRAKNSMTSEERQKLQEDFKNAGFF